VFLPERGEICRGMPTGYAAEPLAARHGVDHEPPPVWPDPDGAIRGLSFSPLYRSAPAAAKRDPDLYALLALVDGIRGGRAGEREWAKKELAKLLGRQQKVKPGLRTRHPHTLVIGGAIESSRADLCDIAERFHIRRLSVFGSAARGELRPESDIDILIEFDSEGAPSLGSMVDIRDALVKLFHGRKVDIATPSILNNPYWKHAIEKEMEELYAA
jgi:predicted nucleotidyltransferase